MVNHALQFSLNLEKSSVKDCNMGTNFIYLGKIMRSHKNGGSTLVEFLKEVLQVQN